MKHTNELYLSGLIYVLLQYEFLKTNIAKCMASRAQLFKANDIVSYRFVKIYIQSYANMLNFFAEKMCSAKATHIFSAKNIRILYIESAKTVNEMTLNELVKLTTLWTTGPSKIIKTKKLSLK